MCPYLASFKSIRVRRGSDEILTKTALSDVNWTAYSLMKSTFDAHEELQPRVPSQSIDRDRIDDICTKLVPHLAPHKRHFWTSLRLKNNGGGETKRRRQEAAAECTKRRTL